MKEVPMNATLKKLEKQLEAAGGLVVVDEHLPDDIAELFLEEIMSCPECAAAISASKREREREH
jgi:hypothetical protein